MTLILALTACAQPKSNDEKSNSEAMTVNENLEIATFGAGCFWCVEAVFQDLKGVHKVSSGYMGGHVDNPTYKMICTGETGHAEVAQVTFDPSIISFETLLDVFWTTHDPTTLNRQGNDSGTQYRSAIFYHSDEQKASAEASLKRVNASTFDGKIVTEITRVSKYYEAEDYHQNFYKDNPNYGYCRVIIDPKIKKLQSKFEHLLKED